MSYKGRWTEPTDREARTEYRALRKELKRRTSLARRTEIEARLDSLCKKSILSEATPAQTETPRTPQYLAPLPAGEGDRAKVARTLDQAKAALDAQLRGKVLHIDDHVSNIAEAHARFGYETWTGRDDWEKLPRAGRVAITACQLKIWRKELIFDERPTWADASWEFFMGQSATEKLRLRTVFKAQKVAPEQWRKVFDELEIEEKMNEVMPERYFTASEAVPSRVENAAPSQLPEPILNDEPTIPRDPIAAASANLAARATLVMKTDSFLTRLAEHSPEMRQDILVALSAELLQTGSVSAAFCVKTYNALRPKSVAAYPERSFR